MNRNRLKRVWLLLWPTLLILHLFPIRTRISRELLILTLLALWLGGTALFWRKIWVRALGIAIGVVLLAVAVLPGHPADPNVLRSEYIRSLKEKEGTLYVWGGEAPTGIDCSGLIRVGMVDSLLRMGVQGANPALI